MSTSSVGSTPAATQMPENAKANEENKSWLEVIKEAVWNAVKCLFFCFTWENNEPPALAPVTSVTPPVSTPTNAPSVTPPSPGHSSAAASGSSTPSASEADLQARVDTLVRENRELKEKNEELKAINLSYEGSPSDRTATAPMVEALQSLSEQTRMELNQILPEGCKLQEVEEALNQIPELVNRSVDSSRTATERNEDASKWEEIIDTLGKFVVNGKKTKIISPQIAKAFVEEYETLLAKIDSYNSQASEVSTDADDAAEKLRVYGSVWQKLKPIVESVIGENVELTVSSISQFGAKVRSLTEAAKFKETAESHKERINQLSAQIEQLKSAIGEKENEIEKARKEVPEETRTQLKKLSSELNVNTQSNEAAELRIKQLEEALQQSSEREKEALDALRAKESDSGSSKEVSKLKQELAALKEELGQVKAAHSKELKEMQEAHQAELENKGQTDTASGPKLESIMSRLPPIFNQLSENPGFEQILSSQKVAKAQRKWADALTEAYTQSQKEQKENSVKEKGKGFLGRFGKSAKESKATDSKKDKSVAQEQNSRPKSDSVQAELSAEEDSERTVSEEKSGE